MRIRSCSSCCVRGRLLGRGKALVREQMGHICWFLAGIGSPDMLDCPIASRGIRGGIVMLGESVELNLEVEVCLCQKYEAPI